MLLAQEIQDACDKCTLPCGVFLNFQKAFDSVNHNMVLCKLEYYGVRNISNNWFSSYLNNRTKFVTINTERSSNANVTRVSVRASTVPTLY